MYHTRTVVFPFVYPLFVSASWLTSETVCVRESERERGLREERGTERERRRAERIREKRSWAEANK